MIYNNKLQVTLKCQLLTQLLYVFLSLYYGEGLIREGGLFHFFTQSGGGGLIREGG